MWMLGRFMTQARRTHVAHVIDALHPGGAERMLLEIANATDQTAFQVSVVVTREAGLLAADLSPGAQLVVLERQGKIGLAGICKFWRFCRDRRVDIVHAHGRSSAKLVGFSKCLGRLPRRIGFLFHDHYGDVEIDPAFPPSLRMLSVLLRPYYVGVHPSLVHSARNRGARWKRAELIQNAIDFGAYENPTPAKFLAAPRRPLGVMIANVRPSKDVLLLVRALSRLNGLDWSMLVVGALGTDYSSFCVHEARRLGLDDRLQFLGATRDVSTILGEADFGVLSSLSEAGPLALLEYTAAGIPFVSTRVGSIATELEELGIGTFVSPRDEVALADALTRIIQDPERKRAFAARRDAAREIFDINHVIGRWEQLYREMAGA